MALNNLKQKGDYFSNSPKYICSKYWLKWKNKLIYQTNQF